MKKIGVLIIVFFLVGCGKNESVATEDTKAENVISDISQEEKSSVDNKQEKVNDENNEISTDNKAEVHSSSSTTPKKNNDSTSSKPASDESTSNTISPTNPKEETTKPKEEPPVIVKPVAKWAMSEDEMIDYAKKCIVNYKPTSGYGRCEWYDKFDKSNSGWFAPTTLRISNNEAKLKSLIKVTVDSTLEKASSQIFDDGKGNIDKEAVYSAKGYFEKINDEQYKFYVFY